MWCKVKGWSSFQHYKNRKPPWIRLYRDLLDDMTFQRLPVESRALAPMLWLLASEDETLSGRVQCASDLLAFRLRCSEQEIEKAVKPLIKAGFLIPEQGCNQNASNALARCNQSATPETETETETETDNKTVVSDESLPVVDQPKTSKPKALTSKALVDVGVSQQLADDYMIMRKAKRLPLTQSGLDSMVKQFRLAGLEPAQGVDICIQRGWASFKAEWLTNSPVKPTEQPAPRPRKMLVPEPNKRVPMPESLKALARTL